MKVCEHALVELTVGGIWHARSSSISPCAAATAAFHWLGVCSICIGSGVMLRVSGSSLDWRLVHPSVVRTHLTGMSVISLVLVLSHLLTCVDKENSSSSVCPILPFITSSMAIWSRSCNIPMPCLAQAGMLTPPLCIWAWNSSHASKHSYWRFMFFIRTSWWSENWYNIKVSSQVLPLLFKSKPLLHGLNNMSIVEQ